MGGLRKIVVVAILLLSLVLKLHNYAVFPQRGATSDEYTYSFLGISLLKNHIPISWSNFPAYKHRFDLTINKLYFPMVYPYFDHPPLNGLIVGGWSILLGQDSFLKVDLRTIRLVPIFLSLISSFFVFLLGYRLYSYKTAIFALLIYSASTVFTMNGRVVFAENLLTPLLLSSLYFFVSFAKNLNIKKILILGVLSGLAVLTKELGIVVFFTLFSFFVQQTIRLKHTLILIGLSLFFAGLYIAYGIYYDKDLFWQIIFLQSGRDIGPQTIINLITVPIIVNKVFYEGWYYFGFLSLFLSFLDFRKNKFIIVPSIIYLLLLVSSMTQHGESGWYMIPLFPFMALASANMIVEDLKKKGWYIFVLLLLVGVQEIKLLYEANFGLTSMQFRIQLIIMFIPLLILFILKKEKLFSLLGNIWFYLLIFGTILITYNYIHPS